MYTIINQNKKKDHLIKKIYKLTKNFLDCNYQTTVFENLIVYASIRRKQHFLNLEILTYQTILIIDSFSNVFTTYALYF